MFDQLQSYTPGHLEAAIEAFYRAKGIRSPQDIELEVFAADAGIHLRELPRPSVTYELRESFLVIVDSRMPWEQQRVELAHELGHVLLHAGRQEFLTEDFRAMQEWQADRFAMYALAPTFMIANCITSAHTREQLVEQLAYTFDVTLPFMDVRLQLLEQRLHDLAVQEQIAAAIREASVGYDYSYRHPLDSRIEYLVRGGNIIGRRRRADI